MNWDCSIVETHTISCHPNGMNDVKECCVCNMSIKYIQSGIETSKNCHESLQSMEMSNLDSNQRHICQEKGHSRKRWQVDSKAKRQRAHAETTMHPRVMRLSYVGIFFMKASPCYKWYRRGNKAMPYPFHPRERWLRRKQVLRGQFCCQYTIFSREPYQPIL
jgi:hypothetical protein